MKPGTDNLAFPVLVDFPATAKFLTPEERAFVIWKKSKHAIFTTTDTF